MTDIATALTGSLTKNGEAVATANQPMGGFKHTNVDDATARTEYAQAAQVQDGGLVYLTSVSGTDTITATAALSMSAYATGMALTFIPAGNNTGATTLNVNGIGAKNVFANNAACGGGELRAGIPVSVVYDGTQFQVLGTRPCVLQIVHATDAGSSHSSTSYSNLNGGVKSITPKSADSKILIEVSFRGRIGNVSAANAQGTFSLYEASAGSALGNEYVLEAFTSAGGTGVGGPVTIRHQVDSSGVVARTFGLQAKTSNASGAVGGTLMVWTLTEYLA